ncbi:hypothetical protein H2200_010746 [Cladophialophora chaetospira]|uniref:Uncharacterized protein n=1 Tax=Cladophialophora chaetospira TaxID=386627 RepID=A0AA38X0N9_9EURO|nr:hypothetical protein H2200_010746 [Cladophialophora chaetospira]
MAEILRRLQDDPVGFLMGGPTDAEVEQFFDAQPTFDLPSRSGADEVEAAIPERSAVMGERLDLSDPTVTAYSPAESAVVESNVAESAMPACVNTTSSSSSTFLDGSPDELQKICLLMLKLLRRKKIRVMQPFLMELAASMDEDVDGIGRMLQEIRTSERLAQALGDSVNQETKQEHRTLQEEISARKLAKKERKRAKTKLRKIRAMGNPPSAVTKRVTQSGAVTKAQRVITRPSVAAQPRVKSRVQRLGSVKYAPLTANFNSRMQAATVPGRPDVDMTDELHDSFDKNANFVPLVAPKFVPTVEGAAGDVDTDMISDISKQQFGGGKSPEDIHEQSAVFVPDRHMNPERLRALLGPKATDSSRGVASGRGFQPLTDTSKAMRKPAVQGPSDTSLPGQIEFDVARALTTREMAPDDVL